MAPAVEDNPADDARGELSKKKLTGKKRSLPVLPISSKVSGLLHDLQKALNPRIRESKIQAIVHTMIAVDEGGSDSFLKSKSNAYILKRLINGVASSFGHARANYAATLMRITSDHPTASVEEIYAEVLRTYGENGSFKVDYSRGALEKNLGALVATASVVRGAHEIDNTNNKSITSDTARSMLRTLRQTVSGDALKWNLTPAVLRVIPQLLDSVDDRSQLKKVLWRWAEERKAYQDGLSVALLLVVQYKLVPEDAIAKLYDTLSDFSKPLMAMFETGFPLNYTDIDVGNDCPVAWELVLRYCATKKGREIYGGVSSFWKVIVVPNLINKVQNLDKNLLLRALLPLAVGLLDEESEAAEDVLNSSTLVKVGPAVYSGLVKRKKKISARESTQYKRLAGLDISTTNVNSSDDNTLAGKLAKLCIDLKIPEKKRYHIAEMLMRWVCANCSLAPGCEKTLIARIPKVLPQNMAADLVAKLLFCYLLPERSTEQGIEKTRAAYLSSLIRLVSVHPKFAPLVAQTVILSSLFTRPENIGGKATGKSKPVPHEKKVIKLNALPVDVVEQIKRARKAAEKGEFSDIIAIVSPDPPLGTAEAGRAFSRIVNDLFLKGQKGDAVATSFATAVKILDKATTAEKKMEGLELRIESSEQEKEVFEERRKAIGELRELKTEHGGLKKCLEVIANFLLLLSCAPDIKDNTLVAINKLFPLIVEAADNLNNYKQNEEKENDEPNSLEQTIHLLCLMCGQDATFASVAKTGAELIGECADDSVTAVLFDMLEVAAKREEEEESEEEDNDSESDDEDEIEDMVTKMDGKEATDVQIDDSSNNSVSEADDGMEDEKEKSESEDDKENSNSPAKEDEEEDKDILDVDIDPDTEDPEVLAAFDKHLSNHMKLLENKKKEALEGKVRARQKVNRMLDLIWVVGNALRLKVEKNKNNDNDNGSRNVAVLFDVIVRLCEFYVGCDKYQVRVATLCDKLMGRKQNFVEELAGDEFGDLRMEFAERLKKLSTGGRKKKERKEKKDGNDNDDNINVGRISTRVRRLIKILMEAEKDEEKRKIMQENIIT